MQELFIVVRPDADDDFVLAGVFSNIEAAAACACDPLADYEGRVMTIDTDDAKDTYVSRHGDADDSDDDD